MINRLKSIINKLNLFGWLSVLAFWLIIIFIFVPVFKFTESCAEGSGWKGTLFGCAIELVVWLLALGILTFVGVILIGFILVSYDWLKSKF